jgi:hypothetical protein
VKAPCPAKIRRKVSSCYSWRLGPGLRITIGYLLSAGAVLLFGLGIGIHNFLEGDPLLPSFLPAVSMTAQTIVLSLAERSLSRRGWRGWWVLAAAVLVSLLFGCFSDDGLGMTPKREQAGLGMHLVRDRAELAFPGAAMTIDSGEAGTQVTLRLPNAMAMNAL